MKLDKKVLFPIPSAVALLILAFAGDFPSLAVSCATGLFLGMAEVAYLRRFPRTVKKLQMSIALASGVLICWAASGRFHRAWLPSTEVMRTIVTSIFSDYSAGLRVASVLAGLAALPAAAILAGMAMDFCMRVAGVIDWKTLWRELAEGMTCRSIAKSGVAVVARLALAVLLGTALLAAAYSLPTNQMERNVAKAAETIQEEGTYPQLFGWATSQLDNWTDSIMLMEAATKVRETPVKDAMNVPHGHINGCNPAEIIVAHYVSGIPFDQTILYPRYWHGYLVFLKPLLAVLNHGTIRTLNGIVQMVLVLSICCLMYKKGQKLAVIPYLTSNAMLMPMAVAKCFQFSSCFYVFSLGCLALLVANDDVRRKRAHAVFLWCGILTAFFDFLTYPIATFGVPMLFWLLLAGSEPLESKLCAMAKNAFFWCIGLGGMWVSKWILASAITGENVIANGWGALMFRTSTSSRDGTITYSIWDCEIENYAAFFRTPVSVFAILLAGCLVYMCCKRCRQTFEARARVLWPFFLVGLAPVAWYAFATNHSMIHYWFTNKACITTFLAILFGLVGLLQSNKPKPEGPFAKGSCRDGRNKCG